MKKELNSYPIRFGDIVRQERKKRKLNQIDFYNMLFPDSGKTPENIKKKMNAVENGKLEYVDFAFFQAICEKCELSADYVLQKEKNYNNKETELICGYTGLSPEAVGTLHSWKKAADKDIPEWYAVGEDLISATADEIKKRDGIQLLKIINLMFSKKRPKKKHGQQNLETYDNSGIFYSLYLLTFDKPYTIWGRPLAERHPVAFTDDETFHLDAEEAIWLMDNEDTIFPVNPKEIIEQIARNRLAKQLSDLIEAVKESDKEKEI